MQRTRVISSNIKSVGYDAATEALEVEFFSGKVYRYSQVASEVYNEMMTSESIGRFFGLRIKPIFACEQGDLSARGD